MKRLPLGLLTIGLILSIGASAHAWNFEINDDDNDLTFNIWFNPGSDSALTLDNYQLDFGFDSTEISFVSYSHTPPVGLIPQLFGEPSVDTSSGNITNFSAATFAIGPNVTSSTLLGSLTFMLLNPETSAQDGLDDIWFDDNSNTALVTLNGANIGVPIIGQPGEGLDVGDPASVPIPAAAWLLGTGVLGLAGLRRKR